MPVARQKLFKGLGCLQKGSWLYSRALVVCTDSAYGTWYDQRGAPVILGCPRWSQDGQRDERSGELGHFSSQSSLYLLQIVLIYISGIPLFPLMPYRKNKQCCMFTEEATCLSVNKQFAQCQIGASCWSWESRPGRLEFSACAPSLPPGCKFLEIYVMEERWMEIVYMFSHRWLSVIFALKLWSIKDSLKAVLSWIYLPYSYRGQKSL